MLNVLKNLDPMTKFTVKTCVAHAVVAVATVAVAVKVLKTDEN